MVRLVILRTLLLLVLIVVWVINGCVTVQPEMQTLDINDLPADHGAVFIAVTDDIPTAQLELQLNNELTVLLQPHAINKIYLPEDWYKLRLTSLPQNLEDAEVRYRFSKGEITRFVLMMQVEEDGDANDGERNDRTVIYHFAPTSAKGFDHMMNELTLPVIDVIPQASSGGADHVR